MKRCFARAVVAVVASLLAVVACGESGSDAGSDEDAEALCTRACVMLLNGMCYGPGSECVTNCFHTWRYCDGWQETMSCITQREQYVCARDDAGATLDKGPCGIELDALIACAATTDASTLIDCVPGELVPPCNCNGGQSSSYTCPPSGKVAPCCS